MVDNYITVFMYAKIAFPKKQKKNYSSKFNIVATSAGKAKDRDRIRGHK